MNEIEDKKIRLHKKTNFKLEDLLDIMEILRSPQGCAWDRKQNHDSIKPNLIEEAYEVIDAIEAKDSEMMTEELGDLLLQVIFHSQMAKEGGSFTIDDVINNICRKLISRHTHIFGEEQEELANSEEVLLLWEKNKAKEKNLATKAQDLKNVPRSFPALLRAYKIQKRAASVGFDWDCVEDVRAKLLEEIEELDGATSRSEQEEEMGDLLFAAVNLARFMKIDPELALSKSNDKFIHRFEKMEELILKEKKDFKDLDLEGMDGFWDKVKEDERKNKKA